MKSQLHTTPLEHVCPVIQCVYILYATCTLGIECLNHHSGNHVAKVLSLTYFPCILFNENCKRQEWCCVFRYTTSKCWFDMEKAKYIMLRLLGCPIKYMRKEKTLYSCNFYCIIFFLYTFIDFDWQFMSLYICGNWREFTRVCFLLSECRSWGSNLGYEDFGCNDIYPMNQLVGPITYNC